VRPQPVGTAVTPRTSAALAVLAAILILFAAGIADAGFGLPETRGLLGLRSTETTGLGALSTHFGHGYYHQDLGRDSRLHWFTGRLGLTFGLGETGHLFYDQRLHGLLRFAGPADLELFERIGESDWTGGLGDGDIGLKLVMPLPGTRVHMAAEGVLRLPIGDELRRFSSTSRDYELLGILDLDLLRGGNFPQTRLHLNVGLRVNGGDPGQGLPPTLELGGWQGVYPPYYPALGEAHVESDLRQSLYGIGLEFIGEDLRLFGELRVAVLYELDESIMTLREQPWRLGLGFRADGYAGGRFFGGFDLDLSRDDFDTEFAPHYPGLVTSIGYSRDWQILAGDPDGDGIRGDADGCPDRPEDLDGFEDGDGCPDVDNDLDGIPDLIDLAPNLPEDFDGFEDGDGRPDLDNDNDGISDADDLCPDRAEDFDGFEDGDGCPDRGNAPPAPSAEPESAVESENDENPEAGDTVAP
jgi:hypothetical protein